MDIVDLDALRVSKPPVQTRVLFTGCFTQDEFTILHAELRLYNEDIDEKLGTHHLITSFIQTDSGSVEMIYDEGFRGSEPLGRAADFLTSHLGISALVLRSVILLRNRSGLKKSINSTFS